MSLKEFDNTYSKRNMIKSPLRYPGGKTRAIKQIMKYIPSTTKELISPFFGGGSLEIACCQMGIRVYGYDVFEELVEFWQCLLEDSKKLADCIYPYYPFNKNDFHKIREAHRYHPDKFERAAIFFVLNRNTFSGAVFSGGMSIKTKRFNLSAIDRIRDFNLDNNLLSVDYMDFSESIQARNNKILLYCDPPYILDQNNLYGDKGTLHKGFNHKLLSDLLHNRNRWILSYNDNKYIRELYQGYKIHKPIWKYGMSQKASNEILILSDDISNYTQHTLVSVN